MFERFPDRFLFGIDLGPANRLALLDEVVQYYRSVLAQLTSTTAEKIAYKNIKGLLEMR